MESKYHSVLINQKEDIDTFSAKNLCTRFEEREIDLDSNLAQVVIGVRRSGKSTLCMKVLKQSKVCFAYVNFDDERLLNVKTDELNDILQDLYTIYGNFTHLFMDEVQNIESWPLFVNRLLRQQIHIIMTGSNANLLSSELMTHMTGRYMSVELYPFSFAEYANYNNVEINSGTTKSRGLTKRALQEYLTNGGLPEILQNPKLPKRPYVQSLLRAMVEKDICKRYKIRYKQTIYDIATRMLDHFCQETSINALTEEMSLKSLHTVKNYLQYLTNAYLLCAVPPYSMKSRERNAINKYYAIDIAFVSEHDHALMTESLGWRLENTIAIELLRRLHYSYEELYYMRKSNEFECDFVVVSANKVQELIQVTYDFSEPSVKLYNREIKGLIKASKATGCNNLTLIMMYGETGDLVVDGVTIHRVLAVDWLLGCK